MTHIPDFGLPHALLDLAFGGRSVGENLCTALDAGTLVQHADGHLGLPEGRASKTPVWLYHLPLTDTRPPCRFLFSFLFEVVYAKAAIPVGCQNCYKVKVCPAHFKGLLALRRLSRDIPCYSKCGPELTHYYSQDTYGGFFYCRGLEHARAIYHQVREAVDRTPALGPNVVMRIKRGCTPYEIHCGPSDHWTFNEVQTTLEAQLRERFIQLRKVKTDTEFVTLMRWVEAAHSIGDNSYLEFTRGRPLYPATVSYEP